jgi:hypothetical protein
VTARGCTILKISSKTVRKMMIIRITFIPPAVEPAQPPTNMRKTSVTLAPASHVSKSAVTNPVEVTMRVTVNAESQSARSAESA